MSDARNQVDKKLMLVSSKACDKYDYLIAVASGAVAGLVDIFFVGTPGDSVLGGWSDAQVDRVVMAFAKRMGWKGENLSSAIGHLEREFHVNYDHRHTVDVGGAFQMSSRNHHLKSLAHSPSPIGLLFSLLDQFQGKASFVSGGQLIRIDANNASFELRGENFHSKLFCGFCNWIGHIMSDVAGSSGGRGYGGRGSGVAIPFYELFQFCDVGSIQIEKDRQSFALLMTRVFQEGYDLRFGVAMALPVLLCDLLIKASWAIKRHFYHGQPWEACIPSKRHGDLRWMLIVGNCTLCIFDGADAIIRSGGNPILFVMRLNLIAWFKLILIILKEVLLRYSFTYEDLRDQFQKINRELDAYIVRLKSIDYAQYERELQEMQVIHTLLLDDNVQTDKIYEHFAKVGIELQFNSSSEFDQKMRDKDFILEI